MFVFYVMLKIFNNNNLYYFEIYKIVFSIKYNKNCTIIYKLIVIDKVNAILLYTINKT